MKKRMDFGHGSQNEFVWFYSSENYSQSKAPELMESLRNLDIKLGKAAYKWDRSFLLDSTN